MSGFHWNYFEAVGGIATVFFVLNHSVIKLLTHSVCKNNSIYLDERYNASLTRAKPPYCGIFTPLCSGYYKLAVISQTVDN